MSITPVNLARISFNMRAFNLTESIRLSNQGLYSVNNKLATGYRFVRPSEDPLRSTRAVNMQGHLDRLGQVHENLSSVNGVITEVEAGMQQAIDLVREAHTLAIQAVDDSITVDERQALSRVADSILDQLVSIGNQQYVNTYLFSGHQQRPPFAMELGGVLYQGDANRRETVVDTDMAVDHFTIPGQEFFQAVSSRVTGAVDLNPALSADTRVADLGGTTGEGVELGRIVVTVAGQRSEIDLNGAATVGDIVDRLNAELPNGLQAAMGVHGINLVQTLAPVQVTINDVTGGTTARDLGLLGSFAAANRAGSDLDARVTNLTRVTDLLSRTGINLNNGLTIRNGTNVATIDFTGAETVEDLLNRMNRPDLGVWAHIADDGKRLELVNRVSGSALTVEENGGSAATNLGLRSMYGGTLLSELNDNGGIQTVAGDDLRFTTRDNTVVDVDLSGADTLQDVIDRINAAAGGAVTAGLRNTGNGLQITDNTVGGGTFSAEALNSSLALTDLGLDAAPAGNTLTGRDVNPLYPDSPFTAIIELRNGLQTDDRELMSTAGRRLERVLKEMQRVQGELASQAKMMDERTTRVEAEVTSTQVLLSDVRDVDIADAAIRFQQFQTALQASLSTASTVFNLSLLDFLR